MKQVGLQVRDEKRKICAKIKFYNFILTISTSFRRGTMYTVASIWCMRMAKSPFYVFSSFPGRFKHFFAYDVDDVDLLARDN